MPEDRNGAGIERLEARPVDLALRSGRTVSGRLAVGNGQTLARYLATRRTLINLTDVIAPWSGEEGVEHLALPLRHIRWVRSTDGQIPLTPRAAMPMLTAVVVHLDDGSTVEAYIDLAFDERLSDHLDIAHPFMPLFRAVCDGEEIGDIALNAECVVAAREGPTPSDSGPAAE